MGHVFDHVSVLHFHKQPEKYSNQSNMDMYTCDVLNFNNYTNYDYKDDK